jgi:hypothetical protein
MNYLEKVKKLLALAANNKNEHEAAGAAAKAQELIDRHKLEEALLADAEAEESGEEVSLRRATKTVIWDNKGTRVSGWIRILAGAVCKAQGLYGYRDSGRGCYIACGPVEDAQVAQVLLGWLVGELDRLRAIEAAKPGGPGGKRYWNSWRHGCVQTIRERLREETRLRKQKILNGPGAEDYAAAAGDSEAMLALDKQAGYGLAKIESGLAILQQQTAHNALWAKQNVPGLRTQSISRGTSNRGFETGARAGRRAALQPGKLLGGS